MDIEACGSCKFYESQEYEFENVTYQHSCGDCRRFPPKRIDGSASGFPVVEDDWWCGEYQKKIASDVK